MAETTKIRLYKIASELNIGKDEILEYLTKIGKPAKNHMALLTDEQMEAIADHFKKDKEAADKHKKKVETFRAIRTKKREQAEARQADQVKAAEAPAKIKKEPAAPVKQIPPEAPPPAPEPEILPAKEPLAPAVETIRPAVNETPAEHLPPPPPQEETRQAPAPAEAPPLAARAPESAAAIAPPAQPVKTPTEHAEGRHRRAKKKGAVPERAIGAKPTLPGLKIMGKVDLDAIGKKTPTQAESEAEEKKKKKKKKIREEAHKVSIQSVDWKSAEHPKKKKRIKGYAITEQDIAASIRKTLAEMEETTTNVRGTVRKRKAQKRAEQEERAAEVREREKTILRVTEFLTVAELANLMRVPVSAVIGKCIALGMMVSINQRLEKDGIVLVADEFGFQVEFQSEFSAEVLEDVPDAPETQKPRAAVVTIMGHVDHGKTSLLDYIRNENVVAGEAGGITQHIGAYAVSLESGKAITFLDTPGHEAFTAMRARGAVLTDIVVLVVAADDAVMPQTVEAISHAQAASVPIIVAINKCDKPDANPDRIRQQLSEHNILVEEWGGKYQCVEISARTGKNVPELLSKILLEAEVLDLKANPDRSARGAVIEAKLDKGKGIVATVLVRKGTLRIGDTFVSGTTWGKVRALLNERGQRVEAAHVSMPVQVSGFDSMPQAGDTFVVVAQEAEARRIANQRQQLRREQELKQRKHAFSLDEFARLAREHGIQSLPLVIKGDVDGSVEALSDSLLKLSTEEVRVVVLHRGVGEISENDVLLASASQAIIVGFHVRPNLKAHKLAEQENVDIRLYSVIYECINEIKQAMEGMLAPEITESVAGTAEVRQVFRVPKAGTIAGCMVVDGKIARGNKVRLVRDGVEIFKGGLASLRRFKDDVREVESGYECGIGLENYQDIKTGDVIESFTVVESKRTL